MRQLEVYTNDTLAGILSERVPGKDYVFVYDASYLQNHRIPVSVTLPLRAEPYVSEKLFPFFTNMLPEGANRKMICRERRIDEEDYFSLLEAISNIDTIGAVNIRKSSQ